MSLKKKYNFILIEDAAHCLPGYFDGKKLGSIGDFGIFSFAPTKNVPSSDGGMVIGNDLNSFNKMKVWRNNGINRDAWERKDDCERGWEYDILDLGYKYNMTDLSATIIMSQMPYLDSVCRQKKSRVDVYRKKLEDIYQVKLPPEVDCNNSSSLHLFIVQVENRDLLYKFLIKSGIQVLVHYRPLHLHTFWKKYSDSIKLSNAERAFHNILTLPLYSSLKDEEIGYIASKIKEFYKY